jgi:hypothetical protein
MLRYATLCYAMLRYATLCYAMLRYATLCYAMLRYATLCYVSYGMVRADAGTLEAARRALAAPELA